MNYGGQGNPSGGYQQNFNGYQNPPKAKKPKKKSNGTGKKWAKLVAAALVFGLIAGGTIEGIRAIGSVVRGDDNANENQINIVKTSSKNVETIEGQDVSDIAEQVLPSIVAVNTKIAVTGQDFLEDAIHRKVKVQARVLFSARMRKISMCLRIIM